MCVLYLALPPLYQISAQKNRAVEGAGGAVGG
jgi:hypothetical protein